MSIRIAMIGAGSLSFTRRLVADLLTVRELQDTQFAFMDINAHNLDMVTQICRRDIAANGVAASIQATVDRREAIRDADYVVSTIRHGGLEAFACDVEIPLKYGVDQCVADTLCAGGITYAQRHVPELLSICADIRELAKPGCLFLNYANPMAINTWAVLKYGGVRHVGLCHGVEHGFLQICRALNIPPADTDYICAGINHQTWYLNVTHQGQDMTGKILAAFESDPLLSHTEKVRIDMLRRFGYYSTESNGHLSEYVPWYRKRADAIENWIALERWVLGETGGYLRVCREGRNWFESEFPKLLQAPASQFVPEKRSAEHFSWIVEAEQTGRLYRGHFNVRNTGIITNLPQECVVEVPCFVDRLGLHPQVIGNLPLGCAGVLRNSISVQELAMEAAVHGDVTLFKQALMLDPLTGAVCDPNEIWRMGDELLTATRQWLPQYDAAELDAAERRLAETPFSYPRALQGIRVKKEVKGDMHALLEKAGKG